MIVKSNFALEHLPKVPRYERRVPQQTVLYELVRRHYKTFLDYIERDSKYLASHTKKEFEEFLKCGVLAHGFLRLRCEQGHESLLGFSCKGRGFCPSCTARRMSETSALLVDHVLPDLPIRQWVVTLPFKLRYWVASNPKLKSAVLKIIINEIARLYKSKAKDEKGIKDGLTGSITVIQQSGGSINLNPHFHIIFIDGVFNDGDFYRTNVPSDCEVNQVLTHIHKKVVKYLQKRDYFNDVFPSEHTDEVTNSLMVLSISGKALDADKKVKRLGVFTSFGTLTSKGQRCSELDGFTIHANTGVGGHQKERQEKLFRYILRPPVAGERLSLTNDGGVKYKLKRPYSDGTTHLVFDPITFLARLASIVPPPRANIVRFHGIFAPNSKHRKELLGNLSSKEKSENDSKAPPREYRIKWAQLLKRVFSIDVEVCSKCKSKVKILCAVLRKDVIEKILKHLKLPHLIPELEPSKIQVFEFD